MADLSIPIPSPGESTSAGLTPTNPSVVNVTSAGESTAAGLSPTHWIFPPFYLYDEAGNNLKTVTFEDVYPGQKSDKQKITVHNNLPGNVTLTLTPGVSYLGSNRDVDTKDSTYLSLDDSTYASSIDLPITAYGDGDFYVYYRPPSNALLGQKRWPLEVIYDSTAFELWDYINMFNVESTSATDQTDLILQVTIPYEAGKMETDFDDIKFYLWNYRLESTRDYYIASDHAVFLVKLPSLLADETKTIYVFGGNSTAVYEDNQVFTEHWDWIDGTLAPWVESGNYQGYIYCRVTSGGGWGHPNMTLYKYPAFSGEPRGTVASTIAYGRWTMKYRFNSTTTTYAKWYFIHDGTNYYWIQIANQEQVIELWVNSTKLASAPLTKSTATRYLTVDRDLDGNIKVYVNGVEYLSATDTTITTSIQNFVQMNAPAYPNSWFIDYINVVEYDEDAPTIGALTDWDTFNYVTSMQSKVGYDSEKLSDLDGKLSYGVRIDGVLYNDVIQKPKITKRINNSGATITLQFNTPLTPDEFVEGVSFEFIVSDGTQSEELTVFTGIVEEIHYQRKTGRIYGITVRNEGRLLTRQPFQHDCSTTNRSYSYSEIIDLILEDTNLEKGRGLIAIEGEAE